jgi:choline dehydrogenase-like flavoprotein
VTTMNDLAESLAAVLMPGAVLTGVERLAPLLPPLAKSLAAAGLDPDPRTWTDEQVARTIPALLAAPDSVGDAARAVLDRAGSSYFADEQNWPPLGYRVLQSGVHWPVSSPTTPPTPLDTPLPTTVLTGVDDAYDVVIVGSGAGGGVAAHVLTERGLRVLLVERGPAISPLDLPLDHERNARVSTGLPHQLDFPEGANPRVVVGTDGSRRVVDSTDPAWLANASAVGGGTLVYGAQAWRFAPEDFRMGSTYGPAFADWPIGYSDLEPYYDLVEQTAGVCGPQTARTWDGPRQRPYPMPPMADTLGTHVLRRGADQLGLETAPPPLLINSRPYAGRPACVRCGACVGFACHANAKNGSAVNFIPLALRSKRCDLLPDTVAERLTEVGPTGVRVSLRSGPYERTVQARHVIVAAGAVETARFLLLSNVGTAHDQVGRYLQAHPYTGAVGVFDDIVQDGVGPGPSISTTQFRHGNTPVLGGGIILDDFVQTPVEAWHKLARVGLVPSWGRAGIVGMQRIAQRTIHLGGPLQQIPVAESRVTLATDRVDHLGLPVAALHAIDLPAEDRATAVFLADRAAEWLTASGARQIVPTVPDGTNSVWAGQHQAGTARMGTDPTTSVTDARGRVWGQNAVSVADGSLHVTNGGVNPVLTIMALAWRVAAFVAADLT